MGRTAVFCVVLVGLAGCAAAPDEWMLAGLRQEAQRPADASPTFGELAAAPLRDENGAEVRTDAAGGLSWFAMAPPAGRSEAQPAPAGRSGAQPAPAGRGAAEAAAARPAGDPNAGAASRPAEAHAYVPWQHRQGPAYPGDFWTSFGRWGKEMPHTLWDDTKATFTNPWSLGAIAAAGAAGIALSASGTDNQVADHFTRHGSQLNTFWDTVGDVGGNPGTHFAVAGAMYFTSLARMDKVNYEKSTTLINALAINGLSTLALKGLVHTRSPNGDPWGWPSGHTSSSFTFATVIFEEYGPWVGAPFLAFASYVGYERIDARNHDFSDVISGALLGMAIGHAVAQNHMPRILGFDIIPTVDPARDAIGVAAVKRW